jgi:hypothetical protein
MRKLALGLRVEPTCAHVRPLPETVGVEGVPAEVAMAMRTSRFAPGVTLAVPK